MLQRDPNAKHPKYIYMNRRHFLVKAVPMAAGAALLAACAPTLGQVTSPPQAPAGTPVPTMAPKDLPAALAHTDAFSNVTTDELGDKLNTFEQITNYNNYYEFSTDKEAVAPLAKNFVTAPWFVEVNGLVNKPRTFALADLYNSFKQEEHVYRLRCVEAWSMVMPWVGFPLSDLLKMVEPKPEAKFVKFVTVFDKSQMPNQNFPILQWPYVEGLRLDEAMNNLTILATGLYGKPLTNQQGAPIRLVVPWKYGFKSIKAINQIELTDKAPLNTWQEAASNEYGFYANVNPEVDHPRWSQATERRIGEIGRRRSLMFNGYEDQVSSLYQGLDLRANF
ncbi:MAG: protein-methionine-sulfoxide reductase catalytic subunit MsrP [Chloroflexota bacterium]|nr:MAG: protein-methionine-sulfoxide reductase catalytic subunit MsrP [Chloroflexota bacterium]